MTDTTQTPVWLKKAFVVGLYSLAAFVALVILKASSDVFYGVILAAAIAYVVGQIDWTNPRLAIITGASILAMVVPFFACTWAHWYYAPFYWSVLGFWVSWPVNLYLGWTPVKD